jgi:flagellar assembly protein FliH
MATIIRTPSLPQSSGTAYRAVAYDLTDMEAQADGYLDSVRADAAKIVEAARREADAIRQAAESAGRRAAEQAIERILDEKVAQQMKTLTPALEAAAQQIGEAKQDWLRHWESTAVDMAVAIAGRLTRSELARRPEIAVEWIREALALTAGRGEVAVRLNPGDYQVLERQVRQLAETLAPLAELRLVADEAITPGGCRVATEFGVIDNQLETQLDRIKQELA